MLLLLRSWSEDHSSGRGCRWLSCCLLENVYLCNSSELSGYIYIHAYIIYIYIHIISSQLMRVIYSDGCTVPIRQSPQLHYPSIVILLSFHCHSPQNPTSITHFLLLKSHFCTPKKKTETCAEAFFYFNGNRFDVGKSRSNLRQRTPSCQVGKSMQCLSGIL